MEEKKELCSESEPLTSPNIKASAPVPTFTKYIKDANSYFHNKLLDV